MCDEVKFRCTFSTASMSTLNTNALVPRNSSRTPCALVVWAERVVATALTPFVPEGISSLTSAAAIRPPQIWAMNMNIARVVVSTPISQSATVMAGLRVYPIQSLNVGGRINTDLLKQATCDAVEYPCSNKQRKSKGRRYHHDRLGV